ncbi:hypothetical protein GGQ84_002502 [Desulfitispora alkaliphila]|uniref:acyclic terpene utilization AtuA family protein n=1 Tax=Desulfitispora alkaliphila TaxID=622674 RepID=UPI003D247B37
MDEIRILSPTAILGYGFPIESFREGLNREPHVIAVDAGSTDPGPYYLGAGVSFTNRESVKRDLRLMLKAGKEHNIPVIVGSAGGSGADVHLNWCVEVVRDIIAEERLQCKVATISAQLDKQFIKEELDLGNIIPLGPCAPLTRKNLEETSNVVAQMGVEPFIKALTSGADVVIAGRAYDPAVFAAYPIMHGFDPGLALHLGKILECASIAAVPGSGSDCMQGTLRRDHFLVEPLNPNRKCTTTSVSAHTLYEKTNPYILPGPGGILDLKECNFSQETDRVVRVENSKFVPGETYTVKLEGARLVGYRTISIAGIRDPIFIEQLDEILKGVEESIASNFSHINREDYTLVFRKYGYDGVMGDLEPERTTGFKPHEIGLIIEVVAKSQNLANTITSFARSSMLHYGYPGRVATAGNLAFPYSPSDFAAGEVYEFSIHHLLTIKEPDKIFPINWELT